jgi:hypothetical protein
MHWLALGIALPVALAIIAIGTQYVVSPTTATRSFGLPLRSWLFVREVAASCHFDTGQKLDIALLATNGAFANAGLLI